MKGTLNVVEVAGRVEAPVVFTSTGGALYGDDAPMPTAEDRIPAPLSPYGASKWAAEAYVKTWSLSTASPRRRAGWERVRAPPEPARRGGRRGDLHPPPLHRDAPRSCTGTASRRATTCTWRDVVRRAAARLGDGGDLQRRHRRRDRRGHDVERAARRRPAKTIEPQLADLRPGELQHSCLDARPGRAGAGVAGRGADRARACG